MKPAREDAFASAGLALNQNRAMTGHNFGSRFGQTPNAGTLAQERIHGLTAEPALLDDLLVAGTLILEASLNHEYQGRQLGWFRQELFRPQLYGFYGQIDRAVTGQDDQRNRRIDTLQLGNQFERRAVGKVVIKQSQVGPRGGADLFGTGTGSGRDYVVFAVLQEFTDCVTNL